MSDCTPDLAEVMNRVARDLTKLRGVKETLEAIARSSVDTVPGAEYAGIMLARRNHKVESVAQTDQVVVETDKIQEETGEGPCLSVIWRQATFRVDDMETESRWPRFSRRALDLGISSMLSFQLYVEGDAVRALNLLSRKRHAFTDESEYVGALFASHAAIALKGAEQAQQFEESLGTRDLIGQAIGILMERDQINSHVAFSMLVDASQNSNIKLAEVARYVKGSVKGHGSAVASA